MPFYLWRCTCGAEVEVLRNPSKYDEPPTEEEQPGHLAYKEPPAPHDWTRLIQGGQFVEGLGHKGKH